MLCICLGSWPNLVLTRISPWQSETWGRGAKDSRVLCWSCDKLKWLLGFMRFILIVVYANREHKHHTCSLASPTYYISNQSFYPVMGKWISLNFIFFKEERLGSSIQSFVSFSYEVTDELFGPYLIRPNTFYEINISPLLALCIFFIWFDMSYAFLFSYCEIYTLAFIFTETFMF